MMTGAGEHQDGWKAAPLARTGLVLLAVVAVFWAMLALGEHAVRPAGMTAREAVSYQPLDEHGKPAAQKGRLIARYYDDPIYRAEVAHGGSRVAFTIPFTVDQPAEELSFFLGATPGLQEIHLNGQVIQPNVPRNTLRGAADGTTLYYMLPPALLRTGENRITVAVEAQSSILALAPFHIGSAEEAARAADMVDVITRLLPIIAISFLIFATLLCAVTNWPAQDQARIRSLMVLMVAWAARTWFISFQTPIEVPFLITSFLYYLLEGSVILAFARHLLAGERLAARWSRGLAWAWVGLLAYLVVVTAAGFAVGPAIREWYKALAFANSGALLVLALVGLALLAWGVATRRDGRRMERLVLMVCLLALAVDSADGAFDLVLPLAGNLPLTFYAAAPVGLLLGLGVVASIAREASQARRTVVQANQILAARLAEQDAELARSYAAQAQMLERQAMLEERQRIVRDMHDGIGGQLLGLMMQVRGGGAQPKQVEEGLQASIADLRLIVDSMDSAESGLAETLRSFEHRARAQVEAAGLRFTVRHGLADEIPGPGPRPTLQILRILQEAVTNAMRHSGGSEISLASEATPDGQVRIMLSDNGTGLPATITGGRGLTNMKSRARAIGGELAMTSSAAGTKLDLLLPLPDGDAAAG